MADLTYFSAPVQDKYAEVCMTRDHFKNYAIRLRQKIDETEASAKAGRLAEEPLGSFHHGRQMDDISLHDRILDWLNDLARLWAIYIDDIPEADFSVVPAPSRDTSPMTADELNLRLGTDREAIQKAIDHRKEVYKAAKKEALEALRAEYDARRNDWLAAINFARPAFTAWHDLRTRLESVQPRMGPMIWAMAQHRQHIAELAASLRGKAASNIQDDVVQLEAFTEIWQLAAATETLLSRGKRTQAAKASYKRLASEVEDAKEIAKDYRAPLKVAVAALDEIKGQMRHMGVPIPEHDDPNHEKEEERKMEEEAKGDAAPKKKKKRAKKGGMALTELIDELGRLEAATPGTEGLWVSLEGTTEGRPQRKPKKYWKPRRQSDFDGSAEPPVEDAWDVLPEGRMAGSAEEWLPGAPLATIDEAEEESGDMGGW